VCACGCRVGKLDDCVVKNVVLAHVPVGAGFKGWMGAWRSCVRVYGCRVGMMVSNWTSTQT